MQSAHVVQQGQSGGADEVTLRATVGAVHEYHVASEDGLQTVGSAAFQASVARSARQDADLMTRAAQGHALVYVVGAGRARTHGNGAGVRLQALAVVDGKLTLAADFTMKVLDVLDLQEQEK